MFTASFGTIDSCTASVSTFNLHNAINIIFVIINKIFEKASFPLQFEPFWIIVGLLEHSGRGRNNPQFMHKAFHSMISSSGA